MKVTVKNKKHPLYRSCIKLSGFTHPLYAKSFWQAKGSTPSNSYTLPAVDVLTLLAGSSVITGATKVTAGSLTGSTSITSGVSNWLNNAPATGSAPKAYLNWILFDEQFKPVSSSSGFDAVSNSTDSLKSHAKNVTIAKNGYLYVYVSNESDIDVLFDNLQLIHNHGPLLEETHYYPFGLTMAGISSKAAGKLENRYKFNGANELQSGEFSDGNGLELYDAVHRMYDAQIGRFNGIDALGEITMAKTPYGFAGNNPISINDPLGLEENKVVGTTKSGELIYGNDDPNALYSSVTVTSSKQKGGWGGFHWPNSTKKQRNEWDQNQNTYLNRYLRGQSISQKGDSESYTSNLKMYQRWSVEDANYRALQKWAVGVIVSPILVGISTPALVTAFKIKLQANLIAGAADFGVQAVMNGANQRPILQNWNPVSTALAFGLGASSHSLSNVAGVSLFSSTISSSVNLSSASIDKGVGGIFSFDMTGIIINAAFGTAAGSIGNQMKVDFKNLSLGEGMSQSFNLAGAAVGDKINKN